MSHGMPPLILPSPLLGPLKMNDFHGCSRRHPNPKASVESRHRVMSAQRIVIKAGTSVVSDESGYPALNRLGAIVEQCAWLRKMGKEVLLVSSGAVGVGRQLLRKQQLLNSSLGQVLRGQDLEKLLGGGGTGGGTGYSSACAAAGQLGLMTLYETLFGQLDTATSQMLVTEFDFRTPERRRNVRYTMGTMLAMGIIPIINENDAVSGNEGYTKEGQFSDNDGLAALVAEQMGAQLLVILTDVEGVFDMAPSQPGARVIHTYLSGTEVEIGAKSNGGRGGMTAKIAAAERAVKGGVVSVVIAHGSNPFSIEQVCCGEKVGTLFCSNPEEMEAMDEAPELRELSAKATEMASGARAGGRLLAALTSEERSGAMLAVAAALEGRTAEILEANAKDLEEAARVQLAAPLLNRLKLTPEKIKTLVEGIKSLANQPEPIGRCRSHIEVADGMTLKQVTVPIGVLLIVFESRPDSLPQIAALALRSGNGLLLKGGKEAEHSNTCLHGIIVDAVHAATQGRVPKSTIGLVHGRAAVGELLKLDALIDLVIPRGSGELVRKIKESTRIPVLGHAEGVCHMYIDISANPANAALLAVDAKTNYPAACNALETLLLHEGTLEGPNNTAAKVLGALRASGVHLWGGPRAVAAGLVGPEAKTDNFRTEYGDNSLTVEIVSNVGEAIAHINEFGSSHTDVIVAEDKEMVQTFLSMVDSACVFHNASNRFADGYRFGLGAEVGISTGRIHARGPVGVEGLLTTKWILRSEKSHTVGGMASGEYTHRPLELKDGV